MIKKCIIWAATAAALLLASCDNSNNSVGNEVIPDYLKSKPMSEDFKVELRTIEAGTESHDNNIYVSSATGYLGRIPNEEFGAVESEYLTQFYIPQGFRFRDEAEIQLIDSVRLNLYYDGFVGDTIANMAVAAYRLTQPLQHNKYTVSDVANMMGDLLGTTSYWAGRGTSITLNEKGQPNGFKLSIKLPKELGQEFLERSKAGDPVFSNQAAFNQWFSGVYFNISAGQGSVIRVTSTELAFYYTKEVEEVDPKTKEKKRVKKAFSQALIHTSEVPQLSKFINYKTDHLMASPGKVHIKAPAGTWVEMTIPTTQIVERLKDTPQGYTRRLNAATYTLQGITPELENANNPYRLLVPNTLLMLPKERAQRFFEKELTENAPSELYTSFLGEIAVKGSNTYYFGNIGSLLLEHITKHPNEDLVVLLIPVERVATPAGQGNRTISLSHLVLPSAVSFELNERNTKLEATIIEHKSGAPF